MPSKMPPGFLELRNEMALRAMIRDRYTKEANRLPFNEVKPMPPIAPEDLERMRNEVQYDSLGRVVMPTPKPPEIRMEKGGSLRTRLLNYAVPSALTAGSEDPVDYATLFGSMKANVPAALAAYHSTLNENEDAELAKRHGPAGFYTRSPGQSFGTPLERAPVCGKDLSYAVHMRELQEMNPHLSSMSPTERARAIKNYVDYKQMQEMSKPRFAGGGSNKKEVVDVARRGFLRLRDPSPVGLPQHLRAMVISKQGDKALTQLESDLAKFHADNPDLFEKTVETVKATPISRRSVLQSAVGQAARHALPMGELAALGKVASPVAHVAEVAKAVAKPIGAESIAALMSKAIGMGLNEEQAAKFVKAHVPNADEHAMLDDLHHTLANPENYEIDNDILHPGTIMKNWIGIGGGKNVPAEEYTSSLMGIRPQIRAMKREAPGHYDMLTNYARDIADSSVEDAIERGIIRNDRELEMFRTGDPKFWDLVYERD